MIQVGHVRSIDDYEDGGRIKVYIEKIDINEPEGKNAFPLIPRLINCVPKVNEKVLVFGLKDDSRNSLQRFYIGPIISQYQNIFEALGDRAMSSFDHIPYQNKIALKNYANAKGCFSDKDEIAINGRKNCDIIVGDNSIRIRSGARMFDEGTTKAFKFNTANPAFAQLTFHEKPFVVDKPVIDRQGDITKKQQTVESTAVIAAEEVMLVSARDYPYDLTRGRGEMITDESMKKLIEELHPIPYGDVLAKYLNIFRTAFLNHVHNWGPAEPCPGSEGYDKLVNLDFNEMVSENIRTS